MALQHRADRSPGAPANESAFPHPAWEDAKQLANPALEGSGVQPTLFLASYGSAQSPPQLADAWVVPLVFALIMLVGLVGNSLVIYVISKHRRMRTVTNFYIANLATTDIIFLVCCVPFTAALYPLPSWIFGDFMCRFVSYLQQVTAQAACITLTAMSVDRCYATVWPLKSLHHRTPQVAVAVSLSIWIGSFVLSFPVAMYQKLEKGYWYGPQIYCTESYPSVYHKKAFILYNFLAVYLLPLITMCACYAFMLKRMSRPVIEPADNNHQVQLLEKMSKAMHTKISKMVVVIVLLFAICWGPIQLFLLFQAFDASFRKSYETYAIKIWAHCMSYFNSSINPIVCAFMGANFRKSFKEVFPFKFKQRVGSTRDAVLETQTGNSSLQQHAEKGCSRPSSSSGAWPTQSYMTSFLQMLSNHEREEVYSEVRRLIENFTGAEYQHPQSNIVIVDVNNDVPGPAAAPTVAKKALTDFDKWENVHDDEGLLLRVQSMH
ncbi:G-protein coupled receptor 54-like [Latimeria chalumnae]|uniref:G-protein coupled receptor 54-like n=1 Tax=Latimeria chalumnae TaxID=7897 RepID=UPI00313B45D8